MTTRSQKGIPKGRCQICAHVERARIDYLFARGIPAAELVTRYKLQRDATYRHVKKHISADFLRSIKLGPFKDEATLRKLCAEAGTSILDNLRSVYGGLADRWLVAFEAGADNTLTKLTSHLHQNLELQAKLTKELMPAPSTVVNNIMALPDFAVVQRLLLEATADCPEVRARIVRGFKQLAARPEPIEIRAEAEAAE